jgi:hypothetical protein
LNRFSSVNCLKKSLLPTKPNQGQNGVLFRVPSDKSRLPIDDGLAAVGHSTNS